MEDLVNDIDGISIAIGALLSVPLAIIANLLTPKAQTALDDWARSRRKKQSVQSRKRIYRELEALRQQYEATAAFVASPSDLRTYILVGLVRVAFYGAAGSLLRVFLFVFPPFHVVATVVVGVLVIRTCLELLRAYDRTSRFHEYAEYAAGRKARLEASLEQRGE